MTVESAVYINTLDATLPTGADNRSEGDDHIRLVKGAIKATFPNITSPLLVGHRVLFYLWPLHLLLRL